MNKGVFKVFVVDDEPGMCVGVKRTLDGFIVRMEDFQEEIIFDVETYDAGEPLLERLKEIRPHILLLDSKLPGISGLEILEHLSREKIEICTVMITAYASIETAISAIKHGAFDFLAKPFAPDELRVLVDKAVRHVLLLRQSRRLEQERKKIRFEFISVLAHELKAPLSAIESYVDIIRHRRAGEDEATYASMMDRVIVRVEGMRKLIYDLLDLTSIESGQKTHKPEPVDVNQVVQGVIESLHNQAIEAEVELAINSQVTSPFYLDISDLYMICTNLVSNAIKYNKRGGRVDVALFQKPDQLEVRVTDTGLGISDEEKKLLFKDFSRIKNEKTRHILGSGLGLSIIKKLVHYYKGDIRVESIPDVGTTFTITLHQTHKA